jgi:hypothetical protein
MKILIDLENEKVNLQELINLLNNQEFMIIEKPYSNGSSVGLINNDIKHNPGLYFLYNKDKKLIYIGQSQDLRIRISTLRKGIIKDYNVKYCKTIYFKNFDDRFRIGMEYLLISGLKPEYQQEYKMR